MEILRFNFNPNQVIYLLMVVLLSASCNEADLYYESYTKFPQNRWYKTKPLEYEFNIQDLTSTYDIGLEFSYVYGTQFNTIPIAIYIVNPYNQIEEVPLVFKLRENGKDLADCAGDYCDLKVSVLSNYKFPEKGQYKIKVLNKFNYKFLPNVLRLGLNVTKN